MKLLKRLAQSSFKMYFPHEENNFKARLLHPSGMFFIKVGLVVVQIVMQFAIVTPLPKILGYAANISIDDVISLTNIKRQEAGLLPLSKNSTLSDSALKKGQHMLEKDYWAHVAPDGTEPWYFFKEGGYQYRYAGENLARDFSDAGSAVEAWMASPSHRDNLLSDRYKDIGIAVVEGDMDGVDTTIIVQFLGTKYVDTLPAEGLAEAGPATDTALTTPSTSPSPSPEAIAAVEQLPESKNSVLISPFVTTKGISLIVVGILLIVLIIDAFIISKKRIRRAGGRVFAHISFLLLIMAIIWILKAGEIL